MTDGAPNELNCEIPKYGYNPITNPGANSLCRALAKGRADKIKAAG
jgi:hypothetical protein